METVELKAHPLTARPARLRVFRPEPHIPGTRTLCPGPDGVSSGHCHAGKLLSPQRRRRAVLMLQDRLGLSERRACRYVGQPRSTQRREPLVPEDDAALRAELKAFSRKRPRWGYRQAHQHLLEQGWSINRKRVQRLWREEGLRVPQKRGCPDRRGTLTAIPWGLMVRR
jgi:HTH-like domain